MRVIYLGTSDIAVPGLEALIHSKQEVVAVVTQPDKISGRGKNIRFSPVKEAALAAGLPVLQPERIKEEAVQNELKERNPDLFVVTAYSQKIPDEVIQIAPYGCINIHPSLLPKYRGAAPLIGAILNGEEVTGVTIMRIAAELDAGNILAQEKLVIEPDDTLRTLEPKAAELGARMLLEVIEQMEQGTLSETEQDPAEATYMKTISKEAGKIDFSQPAKQIRCQIRAFDPWPSAYTSLEGKTFKFWAADVVENTEDIEPGTVVYADKKTLVVKCGEDALSLREVQMEGKKRMSVEEFLRGKKVEAGFHFGA
ncbi:MAG: methionyl-tRNA formyltransferase [Lachnospiraceae bacterium]|nr:methionyl-tRNA formyltransferase [Lachnospiraceae bacterium]